MRKFLKNSILEIFETIYNAHKILKNCIDKKEYDNARNLLADCQDTAIQLGGLIEGSEGEGFITVSYIEEYCEALYEVSDSLSDGTSAGRVQKELDKKLMKAESSVKNDIKTRLEVVFMPYKASMWDSLESVWKAAVEDPDCDAYVVPVPYYDRKPDHSLGEFHYEGRDYPDYVPVIHYEAYNLEQRKPDVIYIHNPYDGSNFVTSVDPRFYSSELKKYTDCLAYIPYFVVTENVPENFCKYPACLYADKIFAQSELVRNTYVRIFDEATEGAYSNTEERFVALGSPKFDSIINARREDFTLPEKWKKLIGDKKVILYNTSVGSILQGNSAYLEKVVSVLNYFLRREDVVLWWRPHPLSTAVYDSMRHQLVDKYLKIIDWYKKSGFGIYDDTPDLQRALICTDAYYGDRSSSLVALYQLTGKPIMVQDVDITDYSHDGFRLEFEDMHDDGEYIWVPALNANSLLKIRKDNMEIESVGAFPQENANGYRLYASVAECDNKLYFAPMLAENIAVYDKTTGKFDTIFIENKLSDWNFRSIEKIGEYLFFIPCNYPAIIRYNTVSGEMTYCDDWVNKTDKKQGAFKNGVVFDDKIYLPCISENKMVIFDINSLTSEVITLKEINSWVHGCCKVGRKIRMALMNGDTAIFDIDTRKTVVTELKENRSHGKFMAVCNFGDKTYLFPWAADMAFEIDEVTGEVTAKQETFSKQYWFAKLIDNTLYSFSRDDFTLNVLDVVTGEEKHYPMNVEKNLDTLRNIFERFERNQQTANDTNITEGFCDISDLLDYLNNYCGDERYNKAVSVRSEVRKVTISSPDGTAGKKIHEHIRKTVNP